MRHRFLVFIALGLIGTLAARAEAREADPKQRARVLFKQGNQLFKRGMYLDALAKYREARRLYPSHKIDLNIGTTLDSMGRRTEAARYFERFLVQSADAPEEIIAAARERLNQLKKKLCSVKVTSLINGATLGVDGKAEGKTPLELPVYLEPGRHEIVLDKDGYLPARRELELAPGQHEELDLSLEAEKPTTRPAVAAKPPPPLPVDPELVKRRRRRTIMAYGFLGAAGALAVTAGVLYGVGASQGSSAHDEYDRATDPDEIERHYYDVEAAKTKLVVGHVLIGAAAAAAGVGLYYLFTRPEVERRGPPAVSPVIGPRSVGVSGRF
jgi:tetratricopeptide (TPR) repeat protein